jgi:hypothetical protein
MSWVIRQQEGFWVQLSQVILVKILLTATVWCVPLLACYPPLFEFVGVPTPAPAVFTRLLGAAYLALLVGYCHGWAETRAGRYPRAVVHIGVVSNGLAAALLAGHGLAGAWADWGRLGQVYMWGSLFAAGGITVGLLACGPRHAEPVSCPPNLNENPPC